MADLRREIADLYREIGVQRGRAEAAEERARAQTQRADAAILAERATQEAANRWRRRVVELEADVQAARSDANQCRASLETVRIERDKLLRQVAEWTRTGKGAAKAGPMTKAEARKLQFALHPDRAPTAAEREEAMKVLNAYLERSRV